MARRSHIASRAHTAFVCAIAATACVQARDATYDFALVGDNPYQPEDVPKFDALIRDVNAQPDLQWVIHLGDISGQPCTDELYRERFDLYQQFVLPFVFTPGDNDWFDCSREFQGGYDPYERLRQLRSVFFPNPTRTTGGRSMPVRSQSAEPGYGEFVENVLWVHGDVVYATVHLVALSRAPSDPDVASHRTDAAIAWITTAFELARAEESSGVFIATRVNPWIVSGDPVLVHRDCEACRTPRSDLAPLYAVLRRQSTRFDGAVILAVGDTHVFRVDKPLYRDDGSLVENFTRVEAFGNPTAHWVRVRVDPRERQVFTFYQELVPENVATARSR